MTRLQRLAAAALGVTVLLVAIGGFTRGSGSGYGCADRWPLCEGGALGGLLPRWHFPMMVEWTHRWFAAISVLLVVTLVVTVWRRHREERALLLGAVAALGVLLAQAGLGAAVVITHLEARALVSTHLTVAMVVLGLLAFVTVEAAHVGGRAPARSGAPTDRRWRWLLGAGAAGILATIVLGATVHDQYVGGWPLVGDALLPALGSSLARLHFAHRTVAALTAVLLLWLSYQAVRRRRPRAETALVHGGTAAFAVNVGLGAAHVFTQVSSTGLVVAHILVASLAWVGSVAALSLARRADRTAPADRSREPAPTPSGRRAARPSPGVSGVGP